MGTSKLINTEGGAILPLNTQQQWIKKKQGNESGNESPISAKMQDSPKKNWQNGADWRRTTSAGLREESIPQDST